MINLSKRLDTALRTAAWAHEQAGQHRKGSDIPYIMHPFAVLLLATNFTEDEDTLIACALHDVLEDVPPHIYSQDDMRRDFGAGVVAIVQDVTKSTASNDWHETAQSYLDNLRNQASPQAVLVAACDKLHNLQSTIFDYQTEGEYLWQRFTTRSSDDQVWWYRQVIDVLRHRRVPLPLLQCLQNQLDRLVALIEQNKA